MRKLIVLTVVAALTAARRASGKPGRYKNSTDFDFTWEMNVSPTDLGDFNAWQTPTVVTDTTPTDGYYLELNPEEGTSYGDAILSDLSAGFGELPASRSRPVLPRN